MTTAVRAQVIYRDGEVCQYCGQIRSYNNLGSTHDDDNADTSKPVLWHCIDQRQCYANMGLKIEIGDDGEDESR